MFPFGHRMRSQISRNLCCLSDAVKSICTIEKVTLGSLFWQKTVLEKNAAVTHTEWILAFPSLLVLGGKCCQRPRPPLLAHGDFNQRLLWVTCLAVFWRTALWEVTLHQHSKSPLWFGVKFLSDFCPHPSTLIECGLVSAGVSASYPRVHI